MTAERRTGFRQRAALPVAFAAWVIVLLGGLAGLAAEDAFRACAVDAGTVADAGIDPARGIVYGDVDWQVLPFGPTCVASLDGQTLRSGPGIWPSVWVASVALGGAGLLWILARSDRQR